MLTAFALLALAVALVAFVGLAWMWVSTSWEVVEDDQAIERIHGGGLRGWFGRKSRLLTYRRDHLGRFRRYRR